MQRSATHSLCYPLLSIKPHYTVRKAFLRLIYATLLYVMDMIYSIYFNTLTVADHNTLTCPCIGLESELET